MKCLNCNSTFESGSICPNCGIDSFIFKKIQIASLKLYNKALKKANEGNLSEATALLNTSILFNKMDMNSRNLLGLLYYGQGLISEALKQWIISASFFKTKNNPAQEYIDKINNGGLKFEQLKDSISMYNQALLYMNQKNDDLAIIQLKKAVELNPNFINAQNLLCLAYLKTNDNENALIWAQKALNIDNGNILAKKYLSELGYEKNINPTVIKSNVHLPKRQSNIQNKNTDITKTYVKKRNRIFERSEFISFILGVICASAILVALLIPAWDEGKADKINELSNELTMLKKESEDNGNIDSSSNETLEAENKTLKDENTKLKSELENQKISDSLSKAENSLNSGDYENAATQISEIDASSLKDEYLSKYNELKESSYSKAAQSFYNSGRKQYLNKNYSEALGLFENSLKFASGENFVDDSLYYLGKIAENQDDKAKAKTYFERVINEYPDSNQIKNAKNSLSSLE